MRVNLCSVPLYLLLQGIVAKFRFFNIRRKINMSLFIKTLVLSKTWPYNFAQKVKTFLVSGKTRRICILFPPRDRCQWAFCFLFSNVTVHTFTNNCIQSGNYLVCCTMEIVLNWLNSCRGTQQSGINCNSFHTRTNCTVCYTCTVIGYLYGSLI